MKNLNALTPKLFLFILISLKKTRQCICSPICIALAIINSKIILEELLGSANLPEA